MRVAAAVKIKSQNVAFRVDRKPLRPDPKGRRYIDNDKFVLAQQKTMSVPQSP
jgi:hypothetical protein